jgi:itaconyl-CoA hydratase
MTLGRYFEDFAVGDVFRHPLGRTITSTDNAWFTLLTMNTNQMHFNDHYAEQSTFGRQLVNSGLTIAMVIGLSVLDVSQNAIANLSLDDVQLLHPVFVGDTLYAESIVLEVRESTSRSYRDGGYAGIDAEWRCLHDLSPTGHDLPTRRGCRTRSFP